MKTKIKILIAEHDPVDLELMHHELQKSDTPYLSQVVHNEKDYISAISTFTPDIIISDYTFPSFDGPTAFKIREKLAPDIPFIFLSGTIGEERSIELIKSGVTDYCLKDKLFTLNHKLSRALNESKAKRQKEQIELILIQNEKRLSRAQQVAHLGNWELDFATHTLNWSDETFRIYGLQPDLKRQSFKFAMSFVHAQDLEIVYKKIEDSRDSRNDFSMTYRIVQNNGSIRHVSLHSKLEFDLKGEVTGLFAITQDITEMILLENILAQERMTKQKEITDAVLTAQENERAEIGKDLHDNLNQILGATKLYVELAKTDDDLRQMCLNKSSEYLVDVMEQIRKISKTMIIPGTNAMGLFDCIKILKNDLTIAHPIKILFHVEGIEEKDLSEKLQLNLYRIVQEQLTNILKHAKATHASINLSREGDELILLISDNGKGYDTSKTRKGVGIRNIMSRAESFHGRTEIKSNTGKGYELKVGLPMVQLIH